MTHSSRECAGCRSSSPDSRIGRASEDRRDAPILGRRTDSRRETTAGTRSSTGCPLAFSGQSAFVTAKSASSSTSTSLPSARVTSTSHTWSASSLRSTSVTVPSPVWASAASDARSASAGSTGWPPLSSASLVRRAGVVRSVGGVLGRDVEHVQRLVELHLDPSPVIEHDVDLVGVGAVVVAVRVDDRPRPDLVEGGGDRRIHLLRRDLRRLAGVVVGQVVGDGECDRRSPGDECQRRRRRM